MGVSRALFLLEASLIFTVEAQSPSTAAQLGALWCTRRIEAQSMQPDLMQVICHC